MEYRRIRSTLMGLVAATAAAGLITGMSGPAQAAPDPAGKIRNAGGSGAVKDRYFVILKDVAPKQAAVARQTDNIAEKYGAKVRYMYHATVRGFSATASAAKARKMAADPAVAYVEQVRKVRLAGEQQNPPSWGLDRVDQESLPLNQSYKYPDSAGSGVTAYVLDTGVRMTHQDFEGRAKSGYDFIDNDADASDCHGHGTHVSGTIASKTYGMAKKANIVGVRVLNCSGSGSTDQIAKGVDWVTANAQKPAVANMSLGAGQPNSTMENAVSKSIQSGIQYALAGGNSNNDACNFSPARVPAAITVGASDKNDARSQWSGGQGSAYGTCLDTFAPGTDIVSTSNSGDNGSQSMSGTSMATPHVAGAAALYLSDNTGASPQAVRDALVNNGTKGKITNPGTGSPNVLLNTSFMLEPGNPGDVKVNSPGNQTTKVGQNVNLENSAAGGTPPYTWSATGLPAGLSIDASTGTITGAPTAEGTSDVTLSAKDTENESGSATFTWTVGEDGGGGDVTLGNPGFQQSYAGQPASLQMNATGGSGGNSWTASGLPTGLSINSSTGMISGTPTQWGYYPSSVTVKDKAGKTATVDFGWFVFF